MISSKINAFFHKKVWTTAQFDKINNINWIQADHTYPVDPVNPVKKIQLASCFAIIPALRCRGAGYRLH